MQKDQKEIFHGEHASSEYASATGAAVAQGASNSHLVYTTGSYRNVGHLFSNFASEIHDFFCIVQVLCPRASFGRDGAPVYQ